MACDWIGQDSATALSDPPERAERAPSLAVLTAHPAVGAVRRRQVRVGEATVLLAPGGPAGVAAAPAGTLRAAEGC